MTPINPENLKQAQRVVLHEAFLDVKGVFLDNETSLFETLADITAMAASTLPPLPTPEPCAAHSG
jgi:hypothetical protein